MKVFTCGRLVGLLVSLSVPTAIATTTTTTTSSSSFGRRGGGGKQGAIATREVRRSPSLRRGKKYSPSQQRALHPVGKGKGKGGGRGSRGYWQKPRDDSWSRDNDKSRDNNKDDHGDEYEPWHDEDDHEYEYAWPTPHNDKDKDEDHHHEYEPVHDFREDTSHHHQNEDDHEWGQGNSQFYDNDNEHQDPSEGRQDNGSTSNNNNNDATTNNNRDPPMTGSQGGDRVSDTGGTGNTVFDSPQHHDQVGSGGGDASFSNTQVGSGTGSSSGGSSSTSSGPSTSSSNNQASQGGGGVSAGNHDSSSGARPESAGTGGTTSTAGSTTNNESSSGAASQGGGSGDGNGGRFTDSGSNNNPSQARPGSAQNGGRPSGGTNGSNTAATQEGTGVGNGSGSSSAGNQQGGPTAQNQASSNQDPSVSSASRLDPCSAARQGLVFETTSSVFVPYIYELVTDEKPLDVARKVELAVQDFLTEQLILSRCPNGGGRHARQLMPTISGADLGAIVGIGTDLTTVLNRGCPNRGGNDRSRCYVMEGLVRLFFDGITVVQDYPSLHRYVAFLIAHASTRQTLEDASVFFDQVRDPPSNGGFSDNEDPTSQEIDTSGGAVAEQNPPNAGDTAHVDQTPALGDSLFVDVDLSNNGGGNQNPGTGDNTGGANGVPEIINEPNPSFSGATDASVGGDSALAGKKKVSTAGIFFVSLVAVSILVGSGLVAAKKRGDLLNISRGVQLEGSSIDGSDSDYPFQEKVAQVGTYETESNHSGGRVNSPDSVGADTILTDLQRQQERALQELNVPRSTTWRMRMVSPVAFPSMTRSRPSPDTVEL